MTDEFDAFLDNYVSNALDKIADKALGSKKTSVVEAARCEETKRLFFFGLADHQSRDVDFKVITLHVFDFMYNRWVFEGPLNDFIYRVDEKYPIPLSEIVDNQDKIFDL